MNEFKAKVKAIPPEIFNEINALLVNHGLEDAEVVNIKIKSNSGEKHKHTCPPGKTLHCWKDANGKEYCRCL